jgi:hypothetical protein
MSINNNTILPHHRRCAANPMTLLQLQPCLIKQHLVCLALSINEQCSYLHDHSSHNSGERFPSKRSMRWVMLHTEDIMRYSSRTSCAEAPAAIEGLFFRHFSLCNQGHLLL